MTYTAIATAAICLPLSFVIPNIINAKNRRAIAAGTLPPLLRSGSAAQATGPQVPQTEIGKLTMFYLPQLIGGAALVEGRRSSWR